ARRRPACAHNGGPARSSTAGQARMLRYTVLSGFLGSGKTTLLRRTLAAHADGEVAVIVNELAPSGVAAHLIGDACAAIGEGARPTSVEQHASCDPGPGAGARRQAAGPARNPRADERCLAHTAGPASNRRRRAFGSATRRESSSARGGHRIDVVERRPGARLDGVWRVAHHAAARSRAAGAADQRRGRRRGFGANADQRRAESAAQAGTRRLDAEGWAGAGCDRARPAGRSGKPLTAGVSANCLTTRWRKGGKPMAVVDMSCDLGESYGNFKVGSDEEVIPYIASASVGCGFHGSAT